jgi:hypothetical protein
MRAAGFEAADEERTMKTRFAILAALIALSPVTVQAGSLENGVWTPKCAAPAPPPDISYQSAAAYNETAKAVMAWQETAKAYVDCLNAEAKADQSAIVNTANARVNALADQVTALNQKSADAAAALNKKKGGTAGH